MISFMNIAIAVLVIKFLFRQYLLTTSYFLGLFAVYLSLLPESVKFIFFMCIQSSKLKNLTIIALTRARLRPMPTPYRNT